MSWQPKPMPMFELSEFYAQHWRGHALPPLQRSVHFDAADILMNIQDDLVNAADSSWPEDKPIVVYTTMTRDNAYQYRLVKSNRKRISAKYPTGVPTAKIGKSLHAFGLAVDIAIRPSIKNANDAGIHIDFQEFRQFLAGYGAIGITSEDWHYNLMLKPQYYDIGGWRLRELLYGENWTDLNEEQKFTLLKLAGCTSDSLATATTEFQSKYSESLKVDGVCGTNTCRAAYVEWAHNNFDY